MGEVKDEILRCVPIGSGFPCPVHQREAGGSEWHRQHQVGSLLKVVEYVFVTSIVSISNNCDLF